MANTKKVVITGGYGWGDIGDEAMPHAVILNLKRYIPDLQITMLSQRPEDTRQRYGEKSVYDLNIYLYEYGSSIFWKVKKIWFLIKIGYVIVAAFLRRYSGIRIPLPNTVDTVLNEIEGSDLVFNVGGANITSILRRELYHKSILHILAWILGKPVIVSGQTIGPFFSWFDAKIASFALNKVNMITLRDKKVSAQRLNEIGVQRPVIRDTADDAMTLPALDSDRALRILENETGKEWLKTDCSMLVGMNIKGSMRFFKGPDKTASLASEIALMAQIADWLVEKYNAKVVFIPTAYFGQADDRPLMNEIIQRMKYNEHVKCVMREYDDISLKGIIGLMDVTIGVRYHFVVFAVSMNVPTVAIASGVYQRTKLKGIMELIHRPDLYIDMDMEEATLKDVMPTIARMINEKHTIAAQLREIIPILQHESLTTIKYAAQILTDE